MRGPGTRQQRPNRVVAFAFRTQHANSFPSCSGSSPVMATSLTKPNRSAFLGPFSRSVGRSEPGDPAPPKLCPPRIPMLLMPSGPLSNCLPEVGRTVPVMGGRAGNCWPSPNERIDIQVLVKSSMYDGHRPQVRCQWWNPLQEIVSVADLLYRCHEPPAPCRSRSKGRWPAALDLPPQFPPGVQRASVIRRGLLALRCSADRLSAIRFDTSSGGRE